MRQDTYRLFVVTALLEFVAVLDDDLLEPQRLQFLPAFGAKDRTAGSGLGNLCAVAAAVATEARRCPPQRSNALFVAFSAQKNAPLARFEIALT